MNKENLLIATTIGLIFTAIGLPPDAIRLTCDHLDDAQTAAAFERV